MTLTYNNSTITCHLSKDNIQIVESYKITDRKEMLDILRLIRNEAQKQHLNYLRSDDSWITEWRAHNLLYDFHFQRECTADVDLSEHEAKWRLWCYPILSLLYGLMPRH